MRQKEITLLDGSKLTIRAPKVKDIMAVEEIQEGTKREMALFANLSGVEVEQLKEMDYADYMKIQDAYEGLVFTAGETS